MELKLSSAFQLADKNNDGFVTLDELVNRQNFDESVLNYAFFHFLTGSKSDRNGIVNVFENQWSKFGFQNLDFNQFSLFWSATQIAKVNAWYFSFGRDRKIAEFFVEHFQRKVTKS